MKPTAQRLYTAIDATWPAARMWNADGWVLRDGAGGGKRASAATALQIGDCPDIARAERAMRDMDQSPLFMIRVGDDPLDQQLAARGYRIIDPVNLYTISTDALGPTAPPPARCYDIWPPLAITEAIWAEGGIGPGRLALMARAEGPKTSLLGRVGQRKDGAAGAAFLALDEKTGDRDIAMIHALEIRATYRRHGLGRLMMHQSARWARRQGATQLALAVTQANGAANQLYTSLGMQLVGQYHYRILER